MPLLANSCRAYIDEDRDDSVYKDKCTHGIYRDSEPLHWENTVVLGQDTEFDHSNGEGVYKLVDVPVLECRNENFPEW